MKITICSSNLNRFGMSTGNFYVEVPSQCPRCEIAYADEPRISYFYKNDDGSTSIYALFFCPHCEKCFFVEYGVIQGNEAFILRILPQNNATTRFPDHINDLSPMFIKLYEQSESAENFGLLDICGVGYRKALEFLVKDFAIHKFPSDGEAIKRMPLAACIQKYCDDSRIKILAERSAWLGNDETHYVRKHEDRNFSDMKSFIQAIVYFIGMVLITDDAGSILPKK